MTYSFTPATENSFVTQFVEWRQDTSDAPLEYAETLALCALSAVASSRLRIPLKQIPWPVHTNLYALLLGPSTVYRKSASLNSLEAVLREVAPQTLMSTPGSPEGLVQDLQRHESTGGTLFVDELAWLMKSMKTRNHMKDMPGYLMRAYDGAAISLRNKAKLIKGELVEEETKVKSPVLTMVAGATPDRLSGVSDRSDLEDGWWPRWVVCWPQERPPLQPLSAGGPEHQRLQVAIVERLRQINARLGQSPKNAILTGGAWGVAQQYVQQYEETILQDPENGALYSRADLRLFKVAALLALANDKLQDGPVVITEDEVNDAHAMNVRWIGDAKKLMSKLGQDEFENALNRTFAYVLRTGPSVWRSVVANAMHYRAKMFAEIEESLLERGLITKTELSGRELWVAAELEDEEYNLHNDVLNSRAAAMLDRMP